MRVEMGARVGVKLGLGLRGSVWVGIGMVLFCGELVIVEWFLRRAPPRACLKLQPGVSKSYFLRTLCYVSVRAGS